MNTPCYYFDTDVFAERVRTVKNALGGVPLTFSIKANPFLLEALPEEIDHVEVCSPGELNICMSLSVSPERIIYSGVVKNEEDVHTAVNYGVDIITCESIRHAQLIQAEGKKMKTLLRITGGNQFGMSVSDAIGILSDAEGFSNLDIIGIHFFTGTQKNLRKITKDLEKLESALSELKEATGFEPKMVEYGPGLAVDYFGENPEETEMNNLSEAAEPLKDFAKKYPLAIELGRFLAAPCGSYYTSVCDIKNSYDTNYLMVDGGIHHLNYYGQRMAMEIPPMIIARQGETVISYADFSASEEDKVAYCICGSLCTVADLLIREAELPKLSIGDVLGFHRCGAYSMTEAPALFLSRDLPKIYITSKEKGEVLVRDTLHASTINRRSN